MVVDLAYTSWGMMGQVFGEVNESTMFIFFIFFVENRSTPLEDIKRAGLQPVG